MLPSQIDLVFVLIHLTLNAVSVSGTTDRGDGQGQRFYDKERKDQIQELLKFNGKDFDDDVSQVPFHAAFVFEDVDDIYWVHEWLLNDIINQHAS